MEYLVTLKTKNDCISFSFDSHVEASEFANTSLEHQALFDPEDTLVVELTIISE